MLHGLAEKGYHREPQFNLSSILTLCCTDLSASNLNCNCDYCNCYQLLSGLHKFNEYSIFQGPVQRLFQIVGCRKQSKRTDCY